MRDAMAGLGIAFFVIVGGISGLAMLGGLRPEAPVGSVIGPTIVACLCVMGLLVAVLIDRQREILFYQHQVNELLRQLLSQRTPSPPPVTAKKVPDVVISLPPESDEPRKPPRRRR